MPHHRATRPHRPISPPYEQDIPGDLWFRVAEMPAGTTYSRHTHHWGEFVYSFSGLLEVLAEQNHLLAPPHYGIWLPPAVTHEGLNRNGATHCTLYLCAALSAALPERACSLEITPLTAMLLSHLRQNPPALPLSDEHSRLLMVLRDQLIRAPVKDNFLPFSGDPVIRPILERLEQAPGDNTPLAILAREAGVTMRTLHRKCETTLGMPLNEWRQRLRVVRALALLEQGEKIESVAFEMGYSSASAFIAMFSRQTGRTPGSRE